MTLAEAMSLRDQWQGQADCEAAKGTRRALRAADVVRALDALLARLRAEDTQPGTFAALAKGKAGPIAALRQVGWIVESQINDDEMIIRVRAPTKGK